MKNQILLLVAGVITLLSACDPNTGENPCEVEFDQQAMFQNYTNSLIVPAFTDLKSKVDAMATQTEAFTTTPSAATLSDVQTAFYEAYRSWQSAAQYNFGPAEEVFLRSSVNNFPLDTAAMNANVQNGNYDFDMPDAFDKGFPAVDYLLHNTYGNNAVILEKFTTSTDASKYIQYLTDVVTDIKERVDYTYNAWVNGDYANTFNSNTGTAAGTSLSLLVNHFNENYEFIKRDKMGIPTGVVTLGFTNPTKTEAYYSGHSIELVKTALNAAEQMYLGANGLGMDDYLEAIGAEKNETTLNQAIKNQFESAKNALNNLSGRLSEAVDNNNNATVTAYNELSKQLVNIKTDMPSVMCISITYIDNPSDSD